jgi:hypothetical protein
VIVNNLAPYKTQRSRRFLIDPLNIRVRITSIYVLWLKQIALGPAKIRYLLLARGIFLSVPALVRPTLGYVLHYHTAPHGIRWTFEILAST